MTVAVSRFCENYLSDITELGVPAHVEQPRCRLDPNADKYACVADDAGLLYYVYLQGSEFLTVSAYQLQYGTQLLYDGLEAIEIPRRIDRQWTAFDFIPNRDRSILFQQRGSNNLLYTSLPRSDAAPASVLRFGSHTGVQSGCTQYGSGNVR